MVPALEDLGIRIQEYNQALSVGPGMTPLKLASDTDFTTKLVDVYPPNRTFRRAST